MVTLRVDDSTIGTTRVIYETRINSSYTTVKTSNQIDFTPQTKIAVTWSSTKASLWIDGAEIGSLIGDYSISGLSNFSLGTTNNFYGKTSQIQVFNTALTDAELADLTTPITYDSFNEMANALNLTII